MGRHLDPVVDSDIVSLMASIHSQVPHSSDIIVVFCSNSSINLFTFSTLSLTVVAILAAPALIACSLGVSEKKMKVGCGGAQDKIA
jgi:hypothetical protein